VIRIWKNEKTIIKITTQQNIDKKQKNRSKALITSIEDSFKNFIFISTGILKINYLGSWTWYLMKTGREKK